MLSLQILLPGILLHGTFDYVLFMFGLVGFAWELDSLAYQVASMVVPFLIAAAGGGWAYWAFRTVRTVR